MKPRKLRGIEVSAIGYGCMGLSHGYGPTPNIKKSLWLMRQAYDLGCTFFDTAEGYGMGKNEKLVGLALKNIRDKVVIATKFKVEKSNSNHSIEFTHKEIRKHLQDSLKRIDTDYIDLYYLHRMSKSIPIEEIADCLSDLIKEGIILGWGLSQVTEDEIRRANAVAPLTAVQSEYSIMERMYEKDVIPACEELGIGFVPFAPLASGFLTGKIKEDTQYTGDDVRRVITRFGRENLLANQPLLDVISQFANAKGVTPAQVSLAWMLHKKDFLVPIPGSRTLERIQENLSASDVDLTDEEFSKIESELDKIKIYGNRTDDDIAKLKWL